MDINDDDNLFNTESQTMPPRKDKKGRSGFRSSLKSLLLKSSPQKPTQPTGLIKFPSQTSVATRNQQTWAVSSPYSPRHATMADLATPSTFPVSLTSSRQLTSMDGGAWEGATSPEFSQPYLLNSPSLPRSGAPAFGEQVTLTQVSRGAVQDDVRSDIEQIKQELKGLQEAFGILSKENVELRALVTSQGICGPLLVEGTVACPRPLGAGIGSPRRDWQEPPTRPTLAIDSWPDSDQLAVAKRKENPGILHELFSSCMGDDSTDRQYVGHPHQGREQSLGNWGRPATEGPCTSSTSFGTDHGTVAPSPWLARRPPSPSPADKTTLAADLSGDTFDDRVSSRQSDESALGSRRHFRRVGGKKKSNSSSTLTPPALRIHVHGNENGGGLTTVVATPDRHPVASGYSSHALASLVEFDSQFVDTASETCSDDGSAPNFGSGAIRCSPQQGKSKVVVLPFPDADQDIGVDSFTSAPL